MSVIASIAKQSRALWIAASLSLLAMTSPAEAETLQPIHVSAGTIVDLGVVTSKFTDPRRVVVWFPPGYFPRGPRHAVLDMHDGQNLFDKGTAGYGMEWEVDEHLSRLIADKKVRPTIVVGIWNTPKRLQEYVPAKAFAHLPPAYMDRVRGLYGGGPLSDGYLKFIVDELKPRVDREYRVKRDRANTTIMGSSMGGLISLYAIDEYPQVFGAAGMVSTHWPLFHLVDAAGRTVRTFNGTARFQSTGDYAIVGDTEVPIEAGIGSALVGVARANPRGTFSATIISPRLSALPHAYGADSHAGLGARGVSAW